MCMWKASFSLLKMMFLCNNIHRVKEKKREKKNCFLQMVFCILHEIWYGRKLRKYYFVVFTFTFRSLHPSAIPTFSLLLFLLLLLIFPISQKTSTYFIHIQLLDKKSLLCSVDVMFYVCLLAIWKLLCSVDAGGLPSIYQKLCEKNQEQTQTQTHTHTQTRQKSSWIG